MAKKTPINPADHVSALRMNGMRGRMLSLPAVGKKKREMLLLYGHHASLERMFGIAENLNQYGPVTMPDLPGFGGMDSFYKIGEKPTLDNYADYLAAFIKLRFKRKRVTIIAVSFGFPIVARMLQKYPDLSKKVDLLVSAVGFSHYSDFTFKGLELVGLKSASFVGSGRFAAWLVQHTLLTTPVLRMILGAASSSHAKLKDANRDLKQQRIEFEIGLWQMNDFRTWTYTIRAMLKLNLCNEQVNLPLYHIGVKGDRYLDNHAVEQHLRIIFSDFTHLPTKLTIHAPTVVATAKEAAPFIPDKLRRLLAKS